MSTKITKNQTAKVGEKYSYKYVDIAQIHEYLEANNIIWLSGEKFSKFIKRHKRDNLRPMNIICDNYPHARLTWATNDMSNAISYKEYIAIKEKIKKELDERADEIFKKTL